MVGYILSNDEENERGLSYDFEGRFFVYIKDGWMDGWVDFLHT